MLEMTGEHEARIAELSAAIDPQRHAMADQAERWQAAAARWLGSWWRDVVAQVISRHPTVVERLSANEELSDVKANVESLLSSAGQVIAHEFGDDEIWAHRWPLSRLERAAKSMTTYQDDEVSYRTTGNRAPDHMDEPTRRAMGRLGEILQPAGLDPPEHSHRSFEMRGGALRYSFAYDWNQETSDELATYAELYAGLLGTVKELADTKEQVAQSKARDLWNDA
jgi:hypothetical protein